MSIKIALLSQLIIIVSLIATACKPRSTNTLSDSLSPDPVYIPIEFSGTDAKAVYRTVRDGLKTNGINATEVSRTASERVYNIETVLLCSHYQIDDKARLEVWTKTNLLGWSCYTPIKLPNGAPKDHYFSKEIAVNLATILLKHKVPAEIEILADTMENDELDKFGEAQHIRVGKLNCTETSRQTGRHSTYTNKCAATILPPVHTLEN